MNTFEIRAAQEIVLRRRLKENISERESDEIRRELSQRYGGCA